MTFQRYFSEEDVTALKKETLFTGCIVPDVCGSFRGRGDTNRDVFPAVRQGRVDFYHRGGKLFSYSKRDGFRTHQKYASVLACPETKNYVTESELRDVRSITSFTDRIPGAPENRVYERIKENCALYAGGEAEAVSRLYNRFSCAKKRRQDDIVVLDIEVSFRGLSDDRPDNLRRRSRQDRIDLLLLNTRTKQLRFFEAKLFTNNEVRAKDVPSVLGQLKRYREQIRAEEENILIQYGKQVNVLNNLFGTDLPEPTALDPEPRLYLFGFDDDQKQRRLAEDLLKLRQLGVKVYAKGNPKDVKISAMWKGAKAT